MAGSLSFFGWFTLTTPDQHRFHPDHAAAADAFLVLGARDVDVSGGVWSGMVRVLVRGGQGKTGLTLTSWAASSRLPRSGPFGDGG